MLQLQRNLPLGDIREQSNSTQIESKIWNSSRKTNGGEKSNAPSMLGICVAGAMWAEAKRQAIEQRQG